MFKDIFSFYGRIRRTEYCITFLAYWLCLFIISALAESPGMEWAGIFLLLPVFILISQGAKRCHDLGNSGWYLLIPFYIFVMLFSAGDYGANEYGDNPKGEGNEPNVDPFGYDVKTGTFAEQQTTPDPFLSKSEDSFTS